MKKMSYFTNKLLMFFAFLSLTSCATKQEKAQITVYCTTDLHGNILSFDFNQNKTAPFSLANVSEYINTARQADPDGVILLDNGDFLQGQPSIYYYNFVDTTSVNIQAQVMNYIKYDAASVGNHDIESGHSVFRKLQKEFKFPWLSANIVHEDTKQPFFKPYTILKRKGVTFAVLGLTTTGIPGWVPQDLWKGLEFEDMIVCAKKWMPIIKEKENPDVIIGLFHSGYDYTFAGKTAKTPFNENAGLLVAKQVDGFDLIILGHDHFELAEQILNDFSNPVTIINPQTQARYLGKVTINLNKNGKKYDKTLTAELIKMENEPVDPAYVNHFKPAVDIVKQYINKPLGEFTETISSRDALFGPSKFTDLIHDAQLSASKADISFADMLASDVSIDKGVVTMRDMFNLYKYENLLYVISLSGEEVKKYLEWGFRNQYNRMKSINDNLLNFRKNEKGELIKSSRTGYEMTTRFYNYSCAAGIKYTVDVSKPAGSRVTIHSMSDGSAFDMTKRYKIAINSYRASGGGGFFSDGLGLNNEETAKRIIESCPKDVRFYIANYIKEKKIITPGLRGDWNVVPEKWYEAGKKKDYQLLYGN